MTEQTNKFEFGDYALIEQKRFGVPNELFTHKVIATLRSSTWVDVPVKSPAKEVIHDEMEDICLCICCGVDETKVHRYRVKDMRKPNFSDDKSLRISHLEKLADDAEKTLAFEKSRVELLTAERDQLIEKNNKLVAENVGLKAKLSFNSEKAEKPIWNEYLEYDKNDGVFLWKNRSNKHFKTKRAMNIWNTKYAGRLAGSVHTSNCGYMSIYITINNKKYKAHRIAWEMINGDIPNGLSIDHIDHNPLNNSIANLRLATEEEQKKNYPMSVNNKSGYVGVTWCKKTNKWRARISKNGKVVELGESKNIEEAIELRKIAEKELNFHKNHGKGLSLSAQFRKGAQS